MKLVNLTPHVINVFGENFPAEGIAFPSAGIARVSTHEEKIGEVSGIPIVKTRYAEVEGLPSPQKDTMYIVSYVVLNALGGSRPDCVAPNTSSKGAIRNKEGRIIGTVGFQVL